MTIWILDENYDTLRLVTGFESLVWNPKWFNVGEFQLVLPDSYKEIDHPLQPRYIFRADSDYVGRVDNLIYEDGMIIASGKFLESILSFRADYTRTTYSGAVETVAHNIVKANCIDDKPVPYLILGNDNGQGDNVTANIFNKVVRNYLYDELSAVHGNSYNIKYDRDLRQIVFNVLWGKDRTQEQSINDWCLFGRRWGNINSERYETTTNYANYAIVWGEGEDTSRISEVVDMRQQGEELREISVDARDLQRGTLSLADYRKALYDRGLQKLAEQGKFENILADVSVSPNMPYSLGDIVSIRHERTGYTLYKRITEEIETFEGENITKKISFGERQGGVMTAIKRGVI